VTVKPERHSSLGRGLSSLIPQRSQQVSTTEIPLARIRPNPRQPRQRMDAAELEALATSIREHGVLQPILVTETIDGYQLVAGERRFRASQMAGLERIPAVVRQLADREQLELALVENLQRADLGPLEEALSRPVPEGHAGRRQRLAHRPGKGVRADEHRYLAGPHSRGDDLHRGPSDGRRLFLSALEAPDLDRHPGSQIGIGVEGLAQAVRILLDEPS